jgi:hypothetical protein
VGDINTYPAEKLILSRFHEAALAAHRGEANPAKKYLRYDGKAVSAASEFGLTTPRAPAGPTSRWPTCRLLGSTPDSACFMAGPRLSNPMLAARCSANRDGVA